MEEQSLQMVAEVFRQTPTGFMVFPRNRKLSFRCDLLRALPRNTVLTRPKLDHTRPIRISSKSSKHEPALSFAPDFSNWILDLACQSDSAPMHRCDVNL